MQFHSFGLCVLSVRLWDIYINVMFSGFSLCFVHAFGLTERIPTARSSAKGPAQTFGEQTYQSGQQVCDPIVWGPKCHHLPLTALNCEAAFAKLCCSTHTQTSPVYNRSLFLVSVPSAYHSGTHILVKGKRAKMELAVALSASCAFCECPQLLGTELLPEWAGGGIAERKGRRLF